MTYQNEPVDPTTRAKGTQPSQLLSHILGRQGRDHTTGASMLSAGDPRHPVVHLIYAKRMRSVPKGENDVFDSSLSPLCDPNLNPRTPEHNGNSITTATASRRDPHHSAISVSSGYAHPPTSRTTNNLRAKDHNIPPNLLPIL